MKVFVDTSAFVSLLVKQDAHHERVVKKHKEYVKHHAIFLTSDYILDELYTHLVYDLPKNKIGQIAAVLDHTIQSKDIRVLPIDETVFSQAKDALIRFCEHKISFTDCTSYVLFKKLALDEVFTLDSDFKKLNIPVSFPHLSS
ncbi:type II toxin-antitoxin system VapC family toxin [Candidatus Gottesmanbacteria bacterium]|nr:type II toxin-antitoxin system VapC family toxin [Candidatus Gottesmanbacteria bacterium]